MTTYKIADDIRQEIATAIVKQSEPGYDINYFGQYYAVDTDGDNTLDTVYHRESQAPWNPWHDNAVAIPVEALFDGTADFDPTNYDFDDDDLNDDETQAIAAQEAVAFALSELPQTVDYDEDDE